MKVNRQKLLAEIAGEVENCQECPLYQDAKNGVPGEGSAHAILMFIGEAPGKQEDITGKPFVGTAGKFLERLLNSIGLNRSDVFIGNIVKHRPPANRAPKPDEVTVCTPYLNRQIQIIKPPIIIPLGRHSTEYVFSQTKKKFSNISALRGHIFKLRLFDLPVTVIPTYHPAAGLYSPKYKAAIVEDFQKIKARLKLL